MERSVAVIGAGMGGLGAATTLKRHGVPCTLFEISGKPGGRMTTETIGDFAVDVGASFIMKHFSTINSLVRKMGMEDELNPIARNSAALYRDGKFHSISMGNPATGVFFSGLSAGARLSLLGVLPTYARHFFSLNSFLNAYKGIAVDDGENAYDWILRTTSRELAEHLADPVCRALCQYPLRDMSKHAFLTYSFAILGLSLQTFEQGMGSLPHRLAQGLDIHYRARVTRVERVKDRVEVDWEQEGQSHTRDFSCAVSAVWGDAVSGVVRGLSPLERAVLDQTRYSTTHPVVMTLDRPLENPFYGVYISPGNTDILACFGVEEAKGNRGVPPGKGCLFCLTREEFSQSFTGSLEQLGEMALAEAQRFFPEIRGHVTGVHVFKWDRAVEKFPPGRFPLLHGMRVRRSPKERVFFAGSYLLAPCTEGAFASGVRAAREALGLLRAENPV